MTPKRRLTVAWMAALFSVFLSVLISVPSATADDHHVDVPKFPVSPDWAFGGVYPIDPPADNLISVPQIGTQGVLAKAGQTNGVCGAYELMDIADTPRPDRIAELYKYATQLVNVINTIDPRSRVRNPFSTSGRSTILVPTFMSTAFELERQDMFAYAARLQYTATLYNIGQLSQAEMDRRVNLAFIQLTASGFDAVDRVLARARTSFC